MEIERFTTGDWEHISSQRRKRLAKLLKTAKALAPTHTASTVQAVDAAAQIAEERIRAAQALLKDNVTAAEATLEQLRARQQEGPE